MWADVSFVRRSKNRTEVLNALQKGPPKTATQLAKELGIHRSAASRALLELTERGLVTCLTPDEKVYRIYGISERGKEIVEEGT
jgi:predicted ArsR family transcriptional regulator